MTRIYIFAAIALALAGLIGYGVHIKNKADRVDVAEARADKAEAGRAADMAEVVNAWMPTHVSVASL